MFGLFSKEDEPQKMMDQFMRKIQAKAAKLSMAVAYAYANKRLVEQDYNEDAEEMERIERQIPEAIKGGEVTKQAALMLISRKKQLVTELHYKRMQMDSATHQAEGTQTTLNNYLREMEEKFTRLCALLPKDRQAKALENYEEFRRAFEITNLAREYEEFSRCIHESMK